MIIRNIFGSLVKFCQDQITAIKADGLSSDMTFINLDAHSNLHELEFIDYLGITGFSTIVDDKIHTVDVAFAVMLAEDKHLLRHMEIVGRLYEALQPEKKLVYYDAETAAALSWMVISNGTNLLPVGRSETRALQMISVTMILNPGA